jgi:hypothetical protein
MLEAKSMRGFASEALDGLFSCLTFLKPIKIAATRAPREQTRSQ